MTRFDLYDEFSALYARAFGLASGSSLSVVALPQAGGDRRYFRIDGASGPCVATFAPDADEAKCFVALASGFHGAGCDVPRVLACSDDSRCYLQEDLGDRSLFNLLAADDMPRLVADTLSRLVKLQKAPESVWLSRCQASPFCSRQVMWDLNYFKYEFLKPSGVIFDENLLEDDFEKITDALLSIPHRFWGFMMRDCQSRNVMVTPDGPVFIDFQGGRFGPALYDAVSFLWQARAGFSAGFRDEMLKYYAGVFCDGDVAMVAEMLGYLPVIVLFRTLQVLGAYGFRGLVQHRAHFVMSIPGALENLSEIIGGGALDSFPELKRVCSRLADDHKFSTVPDSGRLKVEVFSFSYKKGYPENLSGNGGGFMFDCRAMHNPGRYKEYKSLTGMDAPVIEFLERRGEVQPFLRSAWSLVDPAVERYVARGFSHIQIGFGCTGGQHRSVYCAQATASHLRKLFPEVDVVLIHREQQSSIS